MGSLKRVAAPLILALAVTAACGDVTAIEGDLTPAVLSGDWEATTVRVTNLVNPAQSIDFLEAGGELAFRFTLDGNATQFLTLPGGEEEVSAATYVIDSPFLLFFADDSVQAFAYELQTTQTGNSLTLATSALEFDFDGDGTAEPALFAVIMIR